KLGQYREAVEDAEKAVKLGPDDDPRIAIGAARIYSQSVGKIDADPGALRRFAGYRFEWQDRALKELRRALPMLPADRRLDALRDPAFEPIRRSPGYAQLATEYSRSVK